GHDRPSVVSVQGRDANRFSPRERERCPIASCARTELPALSSRGENAPAAPLPGATATMPPETPDLAGIPISNSHSPERSYSPDAATTASVSRHTSAETTRRPVTGL